MGETMNREVRNQEVRNQDLRELYQEVIIDHGRHPRNFKKLEDHSHSQEGYNPLCGDRLMLYLKVENDRVIDATFEGVGCAISMASASLMTTQIKGKTLEEIQQLFQAFHCFLTTQEPPVSVQSCLGKLTVLGGVRDFPTRIKCATLAWHTMNAGLGSKAHPQVVSTESSADFSEESSADFSEESSAGFSEEPSAGLGRKSSMELDR